MAPIPSDLGLNFLIYLTHISRQTSPKKDIGINMGKYRNLFAIGFLTIAAGVLVSGAFPLGEPSAQIAAPSAEIRFVDGDTIDFRGQRYRLTGFDTPETYRAQCAYERDLGNKATTVAKSLVQEAGMAYLKVRDEKDKYGRGLASLSISGRNLGDVLISKGLARPYAGGKRQGWC